MRSLVKILIYNGIFLLLIALLAEALFGNWFSANSYGMMTIPRNATWTFDVSKLYDRDAPVSYSRDEHGFRGEYPSPDKINILTIGGSTTDQRYLDDQETWQTFLARRFSQAGKTVYIANAGVDGQSTRGHIYSFESWFPLVPDLSPDFILAYIGVNDLHVDNQKKFDDMKSDDILFRIYHSLRNNSIFFRLFVTIKGMLKTSATGINHGSVHIQASEWAPLENLPDISSVAREHKERLDGYENRVRELITRIRQTGAKAIIVTQSRADYHMRDGKPFGAVREDGKVDPGLYVLQTLFNQRAMRACHAMKAICLDAGSELEFSTEDFYDLVHNTPVGAQKIADYLFERLEIRISLP